MFGLNFCGFNGPFVTGVNGAQLEKIIDDLNHQIEGEGATYIEMVDGIYEALFKGYLPGQRDKEKKTVVFPPYDVDRVGKKPPPFEMTEDEATKTFGAEPPLEVSEASKDVQPSTSGTSKGKVTAEPEKKKRRADSQGRPEKTKRPRIPSGSSSSSSSSSNMTVPLDSSAEERKKQRKSEEKKKKKATAEGKDLPVERAPSTKRGDDIMTSEQIAAQLNVLKEAQKVNERLTHELKGRKARLEEKEKKFKAEMGKTPVTHGQLEHILGKFVQRSSVCSPLRHIFFRNCYVARQRKPSNPFYTSPGCRFGCVPQPSN